MAKNWERFAPDAKMYETSQCITYVMYVNKHLLHQLFRAIPWERDWSILNRDESRPHLFNYLDHTFRRAVDQGFVYQATNRRLSRTYLVFSTGLKNYMGEVMYCLCGPNLHIDSCKAPHRLFSIIGFITSFLLTGDWMRRYGVEPMHLEHLPPTVTYGDPLPRFNPKLPLPPTRIHVTHLLREGCMEKLKPLLPRHLHASCEEAHRMRGKSWQAFLAKVQNLLRGALEASLKLARKDPDQVALHYCRGRQEVQCLLPINLSAPETCFRRPEHVATLRRVQLPDKEGVLMDMYEVTTLLPVYIARNNARLLGVPPQEWLFV